MPSRRDDDLPGTLKRSPAKAQRTYRKTHDNAVKEYGEGERAHRTAMASLKRSFEKVGDHWEPKDHKGPSDPQDARSGRGARRGGKTYGGVDVLADPLAQSTRPSPAARLAHPGSVARAVPRSKVFCDTPLQKLPHCR